MFAVQSQITSLSSNKKNSICLLLSFILFLGGAVGCDSQIQSQSTVDEIDVDFQIRALDPSQTQNDQLLSNPDQLFDFGMDTPQDSNVYNANLYDANLYDANLYDSDVSDSSPATEPVVLPDMDGLSTTSDPLDPYLINDCLFFLDGVCQVVREDQSDTRCREWNQIFDQIPPLTQTWGNLEQCQAGEIPDVFLESARNYLNLIRSWSGKSEINLVGNSRFNECAMAQYIEKDTPLSWNDSECYRDRINQVYEDASLRGGNTWSPLEAIEHFTHLSQFSNQLSPGLFRIRHRFIKDDLHTLNLGHFIYKSCFFHESRVESSNHVIDFFPGLGTLPLEWIDPAHHQGAPFIWSIHFNQDNLSDMSYQVYQLAPQNRSVSVIESFSYSSHSLIAFRLQNPILDRDAYRIDLSWKENTQPHTASFYLAFTSCGRLNSESSCHPLNTSACSNPHFECGYLNQNWQCTHLGPFQQGERGCGIKSTSCGPGLQCITNEEYPTGICGVICDQSPNRYMPDCRDVCAEPIDRSGEGLNSNIGVCIVE